jgi:hypothetical protein
MSSGSQPSSFDAPFYGRWASNQQKSRLLLESRPFAVRALDGSLLAESKPILSRILRDAAEVASKFSPVRQFAELASELVAA